MDVKNHRMQIDTIAELETTALLEGLHDEELRRDPKFLATVRKYLKDNELYTTKNLTEIVVQEVKEIPIFDDEPLD